MNDKIKELIEQAHITKCDGKLHLNRNGTYSKREYREFSREKFAELIINECLNIIVHETTLETNPDYREGFSHGRKFSWITIRNKFGIK